MILAKIKAQLRRSNINNQSTDTTQEEEKDFILYNDLIKLDGFEKRYIELKDNKFERKIYLSDMRQMLEQYIGYERGFLYCEGTEVGEVTKTILEELLQTTHTGNRKILFLTEKYFLNKLLESCTADSTSYIYKCIVFYARKIAGKLTLLNKSEVKNFLLSDKIKWDDLRDRLDENFCSLINKADDEVQKKIKEQKEIDRKKYGLKDVKMWIADAILSSGEKELYNYAHVAYTSCYSTYGGKFKESSKYNTIFNRSILAFNPYKGEFVNTTFLKTKTYNVDNFYTIQK